MLKLLRLCMPDSVKHFLGVFEVVEQIALVLWVLLHDDLIIEDLLYCAPARSLKPACSSTSSSSALALSRLRTTRILLGWLISLMNDSSDIARGCLAFAKV